MRKQTKLKLVKRQRATERGEMAAWILSTLQALPMGATRTELIKSSSVEVVTYHHSRGGTTNVDSNLRSLRKAGKIRIVGFRSGERNGQGAAIYQAV